MTAIDVQLRAEWVKNVGYRYDVLLDGEIIIRRSRDPEYEAARVLLARGLRGRFRTIDFRTGKPRMTFDIEKAARLRTVERDDGPPRAMRYRPLSDDVRAILGPHTSHQGGISPSGTVGTTEEGKERRGGETCAVPERIPEEA